MPRSILVRAGLLIACLLAGWALAQQAVSLATVTLDRSVHFTAPDGSDVEVQAGIYQIEPAAERRLRLTPVGGEAALLLQAQPTTHIETLDSPLALTVATDEDTRHLVLLLPDNTALDVPGSLSGVRPRADLAQPLKAVQLHEAAGMRIQRMVPGVPPVALYPADGALITGPAVGVTWFPGSGQSAQARYEICVAELNHACSPPAAVVVKVPTGIMLTQPAQPKQSVPFGPRPGDPDFERPAGSTGGGPSPYSYGVTLPPHFQGKRLQWSIAACVPITGQAPAGQQPESCVSSAPKPITWPIVPPLLNAPADNVQLPSLLPTLSWTNGNQHGVEYFLVCIAKPNVSCPVQPGAQPHVFVARVQNALGFTPSQDLSPFMGHQLQWTVATCNAALGCVYQPQYRRFHVPIVDGSFDSIYPVTQNAKCKNCHQMHAENETYRRHIQLGRFTREEIPPSKVDGLIQVQGEWIYKCRSCHTSATGFTDSWRAPRADFSFEQPIDGHLCVQVKASASAFQPRGQEHLLHDANILWAVDRIPGLGRAGWQQKINAWFSAGAPCGLKLGQPRGQFTRQPLYDIAITAIGRTLRETSGGTLLDVTLRNNGDVVSAVNVQCGLDRGLQVPKVLFPTTLFQTPGFEFETSRTLTIATTTPLSEIPSGPRSVSCTAWIGSPPGVTEGNNFANNELRGTASK